MRKGPIATWALVKGSGASLRARCDYYDVIAACCSQIGTLELVLTQLAAAREPESRSGAVVASVRLPGGRR
jgi:hypothetical protein